MADRDVTLGVLAKDRTGPAVRSAARRLADLKKNSDNAEKSARRLAAASALVARTAGRAASAVAAIASTAGPAAAALLAAAKATAAFGKATAGLAPLLAFAPSLAGALGLVAATMKILTMDGSRFTAAFEPVTRAFVNAKGEASKLTRQIQDLAARGVRPLAAEFTRVQIPAIGAGLKQVAAAVNQVVTGTLRWVNTAEGQRLVATIVGATARAATQLAPKVTAAAVALGRLALRAGDRAITGLAALIGRILDRFTAWANSTSTADISDAISDLAGYLVILRDKFQAVRDLGRWLSENEAKVKAFSNALAGFAIAVGLLSGNPFAVIIGSLTLLGNNLDRVKSVLSGVPGWWSATWAAIKANPAVQDFVAAVREHIGRMLPILRSLWDQLKAEALPKLKELGRVITNELLPAVTGFIRTMSPIVAWVARTFGPIIIAVIGAVIVAITNMVRVIAVAIRAVTFVIGGFSSAAQATAGVVRSAFSAVASLFSSLKSRITSVLSGAGSWLLGIGRAIVEGLVSGIRGAAGRVADAVGSIVSRAKAAIPGVGGLLSGLPGFAAASWAPAQFAAATYAPAGGGRNRTGGPVQVSSNVTVMLDGAPFYAMTTRVVDDAQRRTQWRDHTGKR